MSVCKSAQIIALFREMQIKAIMTYTITNSPDGCFFCLFVFVFFFYDKNKFWRKCGAIKTYTYCWWEFKLIHLFWKTAVSTHTKSIPTPWPRISTLRSKSNKTKCISLQWDMYKDDYSYLICSMSNWKKSRPMSCIVDK